ncbi:hypothetical protein M0C34_08670 [Agarivorans sp. TSD2052]|uniref:hypothetical protein n=1 Tax=Agarivorans sp. TSD2052 TaxID=2937286 RepID=UPI00200F8C9B|nr:hypothetical protein [Agarivorans sp. TSD2052]UPW20317.1 hypothetical protein M0C34_08670 [Agarivorans sp. TSD2052]
MDDVKYLKIMDKDKEIGKIPDSGDPVENAKRYTQFLKDKNLYVEFSQSTLMFKQARAFAKIARDIHSKSLLKPPFSQEASAPFVVNSAFACEMYLKTLQNIYGKAEEIHSLSSLFKHLPNKLKDKINKLTKEKSVEFQIQSKTLFKDHIKTISNAFVDWRYIYEQESATVNISVILLILTVLDTLACSEVKQT